MEQVPTFPAASVVEIVIAVVLPIKDPTTGLCVVVSNAGSVQLSVALTNAAVV